MGLGVALRHQVILLANAAAAELLDDEDNAEPSADVDEPWWSARSSRQTGDVLPSAEAAEELPDDVGPRPRPSIRSTCRSYVRPASLLAISLRSPGAMRPHHLHCHVTARKTRSPSPAFRKLLYASCLKQAAADPLCVVLLAFYLFVFSGKSEPVKGACLSCAVRGMKTAAATAEMQKANEDGEEVFNSGSYGNYPTHKTYHKEDEGITNAAKIRGMVLTLQKLHDVLARLPLTKDKNRFDFGEPPRGMSALRHHSDSLSRVVHEVEYLSHFRKNVAFFWVSLARTDLVDMDSPFLNKSKAPHSVMTPFSFDLFGRVT